MQRKRLSAAIAGVLVFAAVFLLLRPSAAQESGVRAVRLDEFVSAMPRRGFLSKVNPITYFRNASPRFDKCAYYDRKQGKFYIIDLDGRVLQTFDFQSLGLGSPGHRAWSPDGSMMLCSVRTRHGEEGQPLYLLTVDGTIREVVPASGRMDRALQPSWSYDASMFAYVFGGSSGHKIRVQKMESQEEILVEQIPLGNAVCGTPLWLGPSDTLLYVVERAINLGQRWVSELWLFDVSALRKRRLYKLDRRFLEVFPRPDGKVIGVLSNGVCLLLDRGGREVGRFSVDGVRPGRSPDGRYIAYQKGKVDPASVISLEEHIHVIDVQTGQDADLTPRPGLVVNHFKWYDYRTIVWW